MMTPPPRWRFFRAGGFDQVRIDTAAELLAIGELDQKLWVALSCPVGGLEFDSRTLELIDSNGDGHVRAAELIAAVRWVAARLTTPEVLEQDLPGVPGFAIRDDDEEGAQIADAARRLAAELGKSSTDILSVAETALAQAGDAARAVAVWQAGAVLPFGAATEPAHAAIAAVAEKIEDFFLRCRIAAFDSRAGDALNATEENLKVLAGAPLQADDQSVARMPLARVTGQAALPLAEGINPAWSARIALFRDAAVEPLLGSRQSLSEADWQTLKLKMAPYASWLAARPEAGNPGSGALALEKLARYVRDLMRLANNFVAFRDFYTRQGKATFQVGTLYIDGRSCELCVPVSDAAKHAALATLSRICLIYCDCLRGAEKTSIAAAVTAGDADQLMVGRNGVFYDRRGRDWDATITKIIDHPISMRQAFWSPYKRLARLVAEQAHKLAAARSRQVDEKLYRSAIDSTRPGTSSPAPFDVAKFAGIFAAIGLAVGALGTAVASVLSGLLSLHWWQVPLALLGLLLLVSGPAVVLAWLKLRNRNLGPILDANGWAINARACINIPFGTSLTQLAQLPRDAQRSLTDPYAEQPWPWKIYAGVAFVVVLAGFAWFVRTILK